MQGIASSCGAPTLPSGSLPSLAACFGVSSFVPLDAAGSRTFAERVLADTSPQLILGDRILLDTLQLSAPVIFFSEMQAALAKEPLFAVSSAVALDTPFQIIFTSGTTSEPKGIVHTHRNVLASLTPIETEINRYRRYERIFHPLRFLHTLPLSHVFGQFMGLWIPAILSAEVHFETQLESTRMIQMIRRERISVLVAVPRVLSLLRIHLLTKHQSLAAEIACVDTLSVWKRWWKLRHIHRLFGFKFWALICGGASLPPDLERFWNTLGFALIQGYGMTETAALVTLNHPFRIGRGTIGKALPGREVRLGEDGEILVRGDMLSSSTWQNGKLQQRSGEWLATGDLASQDEKGELRFLGRKGDVIVLPSGMNIHPADIEASMNCQPGVRSCVVVPCETGSGNEAVAVVLFTGSDEELQQALLSANQSLASYQQIRRCLRWPELNFPYTPTGKLLRRSVAAWACASLNGDQRSAAVTNSDILLDLISSVTNEKPSADKDSARLSEDLHLDSLGLVQLQSILESQLGIDLADDAFAKVETLGQLRALVDQQSSQSSQALPAAPSFISATEHRPSQSLSPVSEPSDVHIYPHWPWTWPVRSLRIVFLEAIVRPLIRLLATPRIEPSAPDLTNGPFLIIANHVTAYDAALVLYALPLPMRRRISIAMSGEMLLDFRRSRNQGNVIFDALAPLAYWLVTALFNVFPLPRLRGFRRSFAHAGEAIDHGYSVLIFPEGHRSQDAILQPFRPGIGLLAKDVRVPVLPVALKGLDTMKRSGWFRSGRLNIHIGAPIYIDEVSDAATITRLLEDTMRSL